jgi:malonyl-CoA O-methyltransferase
MSTAMPEFDPSLDRLAAQRWLAQADARALAGGPWLHAEVGRRMAEKLEWITTKPASWFNWRPLVGSLEAQVAVGRIYPISPCFWGHFEQFARMDTAQGAIKSIVKPWWHPTAWRAPKQSRITLEAPPAASVQMLWANMSLHNEPDVRATIARWHALIATDGFLMFSCLGPDTCRELRAVYASLGWGPISQTWTDMHDWGDRLVQAGFAEPVMDMEHITLTFATPERALQELRGLGRNLHPARFPALRGKRWRERLLTVMGNQMRNAQGQIELTFEIIYGHAFKPAPRIKLAAESSVSMQQMREMLSRLRSQGLSQHENNAPDKS